MKDFEELFLPVLRRYNKKVLVSTEYLDHARLAMGEAHCINANEQLLVKESVIEYSNADNTLEAVLEYLHESDVLLVTQLSEQASEVTNFCRKAFGNSDNRFFCKKVSSESSLEGFISFKALYEGLANSTSDAAKFKYVIIDMSTLRAKQTNWFLEDLVGFARNINPNLRVVVVKKELEDFKSRIESYSRAENFYSHMQREGVIATRPEFTGFDSVEILSNLRLEKKDIAVLTLAGKKASSIYNTNDANLTSEPENAGAKVLPFKIVDGDLDCNFDSPWAQEILKLRDLFWNNLEKFMKKRKLKNKNLSMKD